MTKFDYYILKKMLVPLFSSILIMSFIFWLIQTSGLLEYLSRGVSFAIFWKLSLTIIPKLLRIMIPIGLLFATLIAYNNLTLSNELTIIKNSGFSKLRLLRPILLISGSMVIPLYIINLWLIPRTNRALTLLKYEASQTHTASFFKPGEFITFNRTTIYLDKRETANIFSGATFHTLESDSETTITARRAQITIGDQEQFVFILSNGVIQRRQLNDQTYTPSEDLFFDRYVLDINSYRDPKTIESSPTTLKVREVPLKKLLNPTPEDIQHYGKGNIISIASERLTFPLLALILPIMAFALVTYGQFNRLGNNLNVLIAIIVCIGYFGFYNYLLDAIKHTPSTLTIFILYLTVIPYGVFHSLILREKF